MILVENPKYSPNPFRTAPNKQKSAAFFKQ
jgi:hypothetical protein